MRPMLLAAGILAGLCWGARPEEPVVLGRERAVPSHLAEGDERHLPMSKLLAHGKLLFGAQWTNQDGGGRPLTKGTGKALSDPSEPLVGARGFNRISAPDANSCGGCHNMPYGISGGRGDFVTNVFVLGQRFDFAAFDETDPVRTRGGIDERGRSVSPDSIANSRMTTGLLGAGYIELIARELTGELQAIRNTIAPGGSKPLTSKGLSFGRLSRTKDGLWVTSQVEGISRLSLISPDPLTPPSLVIRPWHQASNVVSLREFANNAFNHHHGIQSVERFGLDVDPDGDGVLNELTRADVTAVTLYQATLQVPGRVIPRNSTIEKAVLHGESTFVSIGCARCHIPSIALRSSVFEEPGPFNPPTNLRPGDVLPVRIDLSATSLPLPRLSQTVSGVEVPTYSDFKLHNITSGTDDPNAEPLDMNWFAWSPNFAAGNSRFLTHRLWDSGNGPPYFHHGRFTTLRQAILAHAGEAEAERRAFQALADYDRDSIIEFLKTLQILPPGVRDRVVDENFRERQWPPSAAK
jgi:hypothetical protein